MDEFPSLRPSEASPPRSQGNRASVSKQLPRKMHLDGAFLLPCLTLSSFTPTAFAQLPG